MKEISHQKIRALLQAAADRALPPDEQLVLDSHLVGCSECRNYAQNLVRLEDGLRRVMQQQWNIPAGPMPLETIQRRSTRAAAQNQMFSMIGRFAFVPMLAFVFFMVMSAKAGNAQQASPGMELVLSNTPSISLLVPRPPAGSATKLQTQACGNVTYIVQEHDTLYGIAIKFAVPKESIAAYNSLASDQVEPGLVLVIPLCEHTPPTTTTTPTVPNDFTPSNEQANPSTSLG